MSASSPEEFRRYCPTCEPEADPTTEILEVMYCGQHEVGMPRGSADASVVQEGYLSGGSEVEGIPNKVWCDFFHRGKTS